MKQTTEKTNLTAAMQETGDVSGSILIDGSPEAYKERLELCVLRSSAFDPEKADPAWASFLGQCLSLLEGMREKNAADTKTAASATKTAASATGNTAVATENTAVGAKIANTKLCKPEKNNRDIELCKPKENNPELELCKPSSKNASDLCKLQSFWLTELETLSEPVIFSEPAGSGSGAQKPAVLVPAWETTLQLLLEAEWAKAEGVPVNEKEMRDILYSYLYDYAEDILKTSPGGRDDRRFLPAFLAGRETEHVQNGLSLFFGDRLKARLLDILEKQSTGTFPLERKQSTGNVPPDRNLTAHQIKALAEFKKKAALLMTLALLVFGLAACGSEGEETEDTETQAVTEDENAYPGTVAYEDSEQNISDKFGIMHATVLDVQNGEKDGLFIYTLRDQEDPENAWCLNSQDVGSIVCDVTGGKEVAVLFSGDMADDPDSVEFIAILDDAPYTIRQTEGTTISNMMNSFTVRTTKGVELNFIKDNCKVDKDALSTENGTRILIFYTEGGTADHYPLRVYKLQQQER